MRTIAALLLSMLFVGCAVTETGTPGADPSVDIPLASLEAMQLPDDPVSPTVAVGVRIPASGQLAGAEFATWTHLGTGEQAEAELYEGEFVATLSFLPEQPEFRLSIWTRALDLVAIADLRFDFPSQSWVSREEPCLSWSNRALISEEAGSPSVSIDNACDQAQQVLYQRILPTRGEAWDLQLDAGVNARVELSAAGTGTRSVWQLQPGGAVLDIYQEPPP